MWRALSGFNIGAVPRGVRQQVVVRRRLELCQRPLQLREPQSKSPSTTTVPDCLNQTPPIKTRTETPAKSPHTGEEPASLREAKRSVPVSGSEVSIPKNEVHRTTAPATKEEDELKKKRDSLCGLLGVYPDFLQKYRTPRVALVVFCLVSFTRTFSMNGVMMVVRPTLERRYQLMSYESGMILSSNDVASCLTMLPVAFLATHRNKPRFIGYGVATLGLGNLIVAAVHFLSPAYELSQAETDLCPMADAVSSCTRSGSIREENSLEKYGMVGENYGGESSVSSLGILNSMAIVGPALGFIVAGYTLSYYVDITTDVSARYKRHGVPMLQARSDLQEPSMDRRWWLGFLIAGAMGITLGLITMSLPKYLPGYDAVRDEKRADQSAISVASTLHSSEFGQRLTDLPRAIWRLLTNMPFVLLAFAVSFTH
ncbi:hypothetical protein HPB52_000555 [Rhipicephalus sanguineus]|uniref:Uncharacterized protein n=1 Tax=Rhipicephalus sanguineus TaxID=34632 RepID=A0A9D4Q4R3_RHISA|nr:hypothetical protein HPB52_000555 [Rhipicephalus sanguineus]